VARSDEEKRRREEDEEWRKEDDAVPELVEGERLRELELTWRSPRGIRGFLTDTSHKVIAMRYVVTAFVFFLLAGVEAAVMRLQLARPEHGIISPDTYNQFFTMHGTTMMFLFAVPIMEATGLYFVPIMIGTRNVAFPRANAFGYYCYLIGGLLLYVSFFLHIGPDAGWFAYVPLSGPQYSPGKRVDVWAQMITFTEIAALVGAVEIVVTVFKQRAPGMSLNRLPLFVWAQLVTAFMIIFSMPAVMMASGMLASDRLMDTHFFNVAEGGDALLYQHMFWFFGHPEVYIIFIPALGFVSCIVATFSRRPVFGYLAMVLSLIATAFIGFGLWVHHMFATPLPQLGQSFFTGASMMIAIPSGVQIFCWIATMWGGRLRLKTPLVFVLGFFAIFVLGGLSGIILASVPLDLQVHDTYFVVAHFHYVLIGGAVFPLFGAFYYWFPKWTGRMLGERMGKINFWLLFVGFNLVFFPMHQLGLKGMPRRVYTYLPQTGWGDLNLLASIGAGVMALGVLAFLANVWASRRAGALAGDNPWGADTLEWGTASPAPDYNFANLPVVEGRNALWDRTPDAPVVVGLSTECREVLCTNLMDAEPDHRYELPGPSVFPLLLSLAVGVTFCVAIFTPWGYPVGATLSAASLYGWFWSNRDSKNEAVKREAGGATAGKAEPLSARPPAPLPLEGEA
jgi:cytochrome c oxidase subunit I+III